MHEVTTSTSFGRVFVHHVSDGGTLASKITSAPSNKRRRAEMNAELADLMEDWNDIDATLVRGAVQDALDDRGAEEEARCPTRWRRFGPSRGNPWVPACSDGPSNPAIQQPCTFMISRLEWDAAWTRGLLPNGSDSRWSFERTIRLLALAGEYGCNFTLVSDRWNLQPGSGDATETPDTLECWYRRVIQAVLHLRLERAEHIGSNNEDSIADAFRAIMRRVAHVLAPPLDEGVFKSVLENIRAASNQISRTDPEREALRVTYLNLRTRLESLEARCGQPEHTRRGAFEAAHETALAAAALVDETRQEVYNTVDRIPTHLNHCATLVLPASSEKIHREVEVTLEALLEDLFDTSVCATPNALKSIDIIRLLLTTNAVLHRQLARMQRFRDEVNRARQSVAEFKLNCTTYANTRESIANMSVPNGPNPPSG